MLQWERIGVLGHIHRGGCKALEDAHTQNTSIKYKHCILLLLPLCRKPLYLALRSHTVGKSLNLLQKFLVLHYLKYSAQTASMFSRERSLMPTCLLLMRLARWSWSSLPHCFFLALVAQGVELGVVVLCCVLLHNFHEWMIGVAVRSHY